MTTAYLDAAVENDALPINYCGDFSDCDSSYSSDSSHSCNSSHSSDSSHSSNSSHCSDNDYGDRARPAAKIGDLAGNSSWRVLLTTSILVMLAAATYHFLHQQELAGALCYELDASRFSLAGRLPYYDFYFDENPAVLWMRAPTIWLAQLLAGGPPGSSDVLALEKLALANFFLITCLQFSSFIFVARMIAVSKLSADGASIFGALLVGWAVSMLATGFVDGCLQHVFILCLAPYIVLKCLLACGLSMGRGWRISVAFVAGLGAILDPFFMATLFVVEMVEILSGKKPGLEACALPFALAGTAASYLTLNPAAWHELTDWIFTVKYISMWLDQIEYFGLTSVPDRRDQFYLLTALVITGLALVRRLPLLRPLSVVALCGLGIYITELQGLSSELVLLMWGGTLGLFIVLQFFLCTSFKALLRRVLQLFTGFRFRSGHLMALPVVAILCCSLLATRFLWERQAAENVLQPASELDTGCYHPTAYLSKPDTFEFGDKALILCGHKVPAYPIYTQAGRQASGYFINSEPLAVLYNAREHKVIDEYLGRPKGWLDATYEKLWSRLEESILCEKPSVLMVSSGPLDCEFNKRSLRDRLKSLYQRKDDSNYFSSQCGPSEYNGWNYRFATYVLQAQSHGPGADIK